MGLVLCACSQARGGGVWRGVSHGETRTLERMHSTVGSSNRRRAVCLKAVSEGGLWGGVHHQPACDFVITFNGWHGAVERATRLMQCQIEVHAEVLPRFDSCLLI